MASSILDELLEMETRVWQALRAGDAEADAALLSEGFLGVYPSGFSDRDGHSGQLADGPSVAAYRIEGTRVMRLSPDTALLAYLAHYTRPSAPDTEEAMYVTSIWRREGTRWVNVFSQDTK